MNTRSDIQGRDFGVFMQRFCQPPATHARRASSGHGLCWSLRPFCSGGVSLGFPCLLRISVRHAGLVVTLSASGPALVRCCLVTKSRKKMARGGGGCGVGVCVHMRHVSRAVLARALRRWSYGEHLYGPVMKSLEGRLLQKSGCCKERTWYPYYTGVLELDWNTQHFVTCFRLQVLFC